MSEEEEQQCSTGEIPCTRFFKRLEHNLDRATIQTIITVDHGRYLWAGCIEGTICIWDLKTGKLIGARKSHNSSIFAMICVSHEHLPLSVDSCSIWVASMESTISIWNKSLSMKKKIHLGSGAVTALIQVDNEVWATDSHFIHIFDSNTTEKIRSIPIQNFQKPNESDNSFATSNNNEASTISMTPITDSSIGISNNIPNSTANQLESGHLVRHVALVGDYVWLCCEDFICFYHKKTKSPIQGKQVHVGKINCLIHVKKCNQVWGACSANSIYIWEADLPTNLSPPEPLQIIDKFTEQRVTRLLNYNDQYIWSGGWDNKIRVWCVEKREIVTEMLKMHEDPIMSLLFVPYPWVRLKVSDSVDERDSNEQNNSNATEKIQNEESQIPKHKPQSNTQQSLAEPNQKSTKPVNEKPRSEEVRGTILTMLSADWTGVGMWI